MEDIMDYTNETVKNIVDSLIEDEDLPKDTKVNFEVWSIGYDEDGTITDSEMFIAEFEDPDEAINYAKNLTLADIVQKAAEEPADFGYEYSNVEYIAIEVETVIEDEDDSTANIETIYTKYINLDSDESEEEPEEDSCEDAVQLTSNDYTLLEDGSLLVPCSLMQGYNKNDYVRIRFIDEDACPLITYKIISRTTGDFEGVDAFVCEFEY
jgi:hypothetical protein